VVESFEANENVEAGAGEEVEVEVPNIGVVDVEEPPKTDFVVVVFNPPPPPPKTEGVEDAPNTLGVVEEEPNALPPDPNTLPPPVEGF